MASRVNWLIPDELKSATGNQVELHEARTGVRFTLKSEVIATLLLPELKKGLPTSASLETAADASARAITAAGTVAAERIEQVGLIATSRIERASQGKADAFAGRIGFTSWQAAAVVFSVFAVLVVLVSTLNRDREAALARSRSETQAVREFTNWAKVQPEGRRLYERYYHP